MMLCVALCRWMILSNRIYRLCFKGACLYFTVMEQLPHDCFYLCRAMYSGQMRLQGKNALKEAACSESKHFIVYLKCGFAVGEWLAMHDGRDCMIRL